MKSLEGILYPALIILAGIALGLFSNAVEKSWDSWRSRRRGRKHDL